jgi:hypothetical protein
MWPAGEVRSVRSIVCIEHVLWRARMEQRPTRSMALIIQCRNSSPRFWRYRIKRSYNLQLLDFPAFL